MSAPATPDILTTARLALDAGVCPIPVRADGTKRPDGLWKHRQTARPDPGELTATFTGAQALGYVCGAVSGNLELLEFEGRAAHLWPQFVARCNDAGLGDLIARITGGYFERTPGDGGHVLYRCDTPVDGNIKLARRPATDDELAENPKELTKVLIETRGEGGYVVVAPSNGTTHRTGKPWVLLQGGVDQLATITTAERTALLEVARTFDQMPEHEHPPERPVVHHTPAGDSWMDDVVVAYNAATTWAGILGAAGWAHSHRHGDVDYWTRPGKEVREGHSATTNANGTDRLIVFSSSVDGFETADGNGPAPSYDRFGATAVLTYAGDRLEAAKQLRHEGHGPPWEPALDVLTRIGARKTPQAAPPDPDQPWPAPVPLDAGRGPLPGFPLDTLPPWVVEQAADVAHQLQVPIDLPALLAIGALASVVHGKIQVRVAEGWVEHVNVYLAIAMPPSSGKSPAAKAMFHPVEVLEAELLKAHQAVAAEHAQRKAILVKRAKDAENLAAKSGAQRDVDAAVQAFILAEATETPPAPRLLSDDATPEALTAVLAENGGRITIASTEGGLFEMMTGRYSDGRANLDVYLKAWSSDPIRVDRIGRPPVHIPQPVVSVALAVQPDVLRALAERPELAGRGLTARFMYALPTDLVGRRDLTKPRGSSKAIRNTYDTQVLELGRQCSRWMLPAQLQLDDQAGVLYGQWRQALEQRRRPDGDLRAVAEWTGKLEGTALRVAALLHVADGTHHNTPVSTTTMARALRIADYWLQHALAVHDLWHEDAVIKDAHEVLEVIATRAPEGGLPVRDIGVAIRRFREDQNRLTVVLEHLVEAGWIRTDDGGPVEVRRGRGVQSQRYVAHPDLDPSSGANRREPYLPVDVKGAEGRASSRHEPEQGED